MSFSLPGCTQSGLTPLHLSAQEDRVSAAEVLAKHDANLDQQTKVNIYLFIYCNNQTIKIVEQFFRQGKCQYFQNAVPIEVLESHRLDNLKPFCLFYLLSGFLLLVYVVRC